MERFLTEEAKRLRLHREQTAWRLALSGFSVAQLVLVGMPAAEIICCAEAIEIDAIAMSTHGRTGLDYVLSG
ncbi:MAG: universal stress protein, partial [Gemmatimonadales bacterium]